jgi:hypothetical protein
VIPVVIEQILERLAASLRTVEECVHAVTVTVSEDHPSDDALLVGDLEDKLRDTAAHATEAADLASILTSAAADPPTPSELRRGLSRCHALHLQVSRQLRDGLLAPGHSRQLRQLAAARRGPWVPWVRAVSAGLETCREPLWAVDDALLEAWETLAERHGGTDVSVRAVGQQVRLH